MRSFLSGIFIGGVLVLPFGMVFLLSTILTLVYDRFWLPLLTIFMLETLSIGKDWSYFGINYFFTITLIVIFVTSYFLHSFLWRNP